MIAASEKNILVGREQETAIIDGAIDTLAAGQGQVILLSGEPGIGKSSLARYAADKAAARQQSVYWGFSWEGGGAPAYWPWTQILRPLVEDRGPPADLLARLGQLLPEASPGKDPTLNPDQARFQLLESVRSFLDIASTDAPLVLIFEDLHAADSDTLNLLHYIARHTATTPLLVVGTFRDAEARALPDAEALWRTARDAQHIELSRLDKESVRTYLATRSDATPQGEQVEQLFATTEGNPLFLTELVHLLGTQSGPDDQRLPDSVHQVIRQHLKLLPENTESLVAKASVVGRTFDPGILSALSGQSASEVAKILKPAFSVGFIKQADNGLYRFSHALHRDVLYQSLDETDRSLLHLSYADLIRDDIAAGSEDRWTELARHLEAAGGAHITEAIEALRNAASRALKRLAFEDAAQLSKDAVDAFGSGPKFTPSDRCTLLLECASATLLAGKTAQGQELCKEAYTIARTLEDPQLMAIAALTWGSVFVVAKIDKDLIAALQECAEQLPEDNVSARAKVLARLAAALQPAPDPAEPMELARTAISMARSTNDDAVLYHVLRSAISALMDFAPIAERIPLNQEFGALAETFGDVPGRFRSSLRIMIDASAAGDRETMVNAIDACDQLARRIDLPHYLWRAASARAMQKMIEGDFDRATRLIDEAAMHASKIDEVEAEITLPIQRFAILAEWESADTSIVDTLKKQLHDCFDSGMEEAEFFIAPFVQAYSSASDHRVAQRLVSDTTMVERSFATGDRFLISRMAELGISSGETGLAERALSTLEPHKNECASLGLLGSTWTGPVAYCLGTVSAALGRSHEAVVYLEGAIRIASEMKALPYVAWSHLALAGIEAERGNEDAAAQHAESGRRICERLDLREIQGIATETKSSSPTSRSEFALQQQGDVWNISFNSVVSVVRDSKGMQMLARLVEKADQDIHVLDLSGSSKAVATGDAGPALDNEARKQYKERIADLQEQLEEARDLDDIGRVDALQTELDFLGQELSRAFGLGGRARHTGNAAERARVNVRRRIKDAIDRIAEQDTRTGDYLRNAVKTGSYCKYSPM
jgi:ATP/maltotriose-dependent transcriptional regulator MalT